MKERVSPPAVNGITEYLNGIGNFELLTAEQEIELAQAMEAGQSAQMQLDEAPGELMLVERVRLERVARQGDAAKTEFINSNLRLVVSIAKRYAYPTDKERELLDLVQEGNMGLMRAVEKFDWRKGFKFSTYATWWVRQAIERAIANSGTIRVPVNVHGDIGTIVDALHELEQAGNTGPTTLELSEWTGLDEKDIERALSARFVQQIVSTDMPISEGEDATLGQFIEEGDEPVEEQVLRQLSNAQVLSLLSGHLSSREQRVINKRFGLHGEPPSTLTEIGTDLDLTRERIRQIETNALTKLRDHANEVQISENAG
jgi:RNA polymerase sigma factor (sigma-70 family)